MRLFNTISGAKFNIDKDKNALYRFYVACRALNRIFDSVPDVQFYFLTLTLNWLNANVSNEDLHRFIIFMRMRFKRAGLKFWYVWVPEFQYKRYDKYSVWVLHFHIVILCSKGALPNVYYDKVHYPHFNIVNEGSILTSKELFDFWGRGIVFCEFAWSTADKYLSKYLLKERAHKERVSPGSLLLGSRGYGSSQFGVYGWSKWAYYDYLYALTVYPHTVVLKKGSHLVIKGYDKGFNLIEVVERCSPYVALTDYGGLRDEVNLDYMQPDLKESYDKLQKNLLLTKK